MAWVMVLGPCWVCGEQFMFNPNHVPSFTPPGRTEREPICQPCIVKLNHVRIDRGLQPFAIHAHAYDPLPEEELPL